MQAGQRVEIDVDTVDPSTAADFAIFAGCGGVVAEGHDERRCTFGDFGCPTVSFVADRSAHCSFDVVFDDLSLIDEVTPPPCQPGARIAEYLLSVRVDETSPPLTLVHDDVPLPRVFTRSEDVPCGAGVADVWQFTIAAGERVVAAVDTADLDTAADLAFDIVCDDRLVLVGDDEFACTFPPPEFRCPLKSFVADANQTCRITVRDLGSCAGSTARYRLGVERGGEPAQLRPIADDVALQTVPPAFDQSGDLSPCRLFTFDQWQFEVSSDEHVVVGVDTADAETAADLEVNVNCNGQLVLVAANERACTFPPPASGCGLGSFQAPADATCIATVQTLGHCTDPNTARYRLGVERDGRPASLSPIGG